MNFQHHGGRCLCELVGSKNNSKESISGTTATTATTAGVVVDDTRLPWDHSVLCSACCKRSLRRHFERHEQALLERDLARERCSQRLQQVRQKFYGSSQQPSVGGDDSDVVETSGSTKNFSELQYESERLRQRKQQIQKRCATLAVEVASLAYQNEERRESSLNPIADLQRQQLKRLEESVCEGSLKQAIANSRSQIRILRFQWALRAFAMHRLDVNPEDTVGYSAKTKATTGTTTTAKREGGSGGIIRPKQARGIGKIGGLPLPHAGPELYGVLPPEQLQSALRLVASISSTVARCLGILLPHPVLLQRTSSYQQCDSDIIHSALLLSSSSSSSSSSSAVRGGGGGRGGSSSQQQITKEDAAAEAYQDPTSTESLTAILNASLDDLDGRKNSSSGDVIAGLEERANSTIVPPSMDPSLVSQRLRHATAAILAEAAPASNGTGCGAGGTTGKNGSSSSSSSSAAASSSSSSKGTAPKTAKSASSSSAAAAATKTSQYALAADNMHQDEFAIALQFLQNNVIALCIRSGVPVAKLWPAEAVLLNLYALQVFCEDQVKQYLK